MITRAIQFIENDENLLYVFIAIAAIFCLLILFVTFIEYLKEVRHANANHAPLSTDDFGSKGSPTEWAEDLCIGYESGHLPKEARWKVDADQRSR